MQATVYNFDRFTIREFLHREITILEISGAYSHALNKKLLRQAAKVRNNLGLDLAGLADLQPGLLSTLQQIQKRVRARRKSFLLCNPPDKLIDLLTLNDLLDEFQVARGKEVISRTRRSIVEELEQRETGDILEETNQLEDIPVSTEIVQFNQSLKRTEHLEKGLDSASDCIRKILPSRPPRVPGYDFAFSYVPCDKVGGDFFDFIPLGPDVLGISIGDVSGHGLDSAIVMAMAKKILRLRARDLAHRPVTETLSQANRDLSEELRSRIFVTALFARIRLADGLVEFARAGHEPPVQFFPGAGVPAQTHSSSGLAIGIDEGARFDELIESRCLQVDSGEGLLLYTDGIVETWNARRDLFSRSRLAYTLERLQASCTAESVIRTIGAAVGTFCRGIAPEDDMTAIVIMRD